MSSQSSKRIDPAKLPLSEAELRALFAPEVPWESSFRVSREEAIERRIPPDIGGEAAALIRVIGPFLHPRRALDIGTNLGYSAKVLTEAFSDGEVISIERDSERALEAKQRLQSQEVSGLLTLISGDAKDYLEGLNGTFGLILLDADKSDYLAMLDRVLELLDPKGLLVVDDISFLTHEFSPEQRGFAEPVAEFVSAILARDELKISYLPVGDGLLLCRHA